VSLPYEFEVPQRDFDLVEVLAAVLGAQEVKGAAGGGVTGQELLRQRLDFPVDRLGDRDREVGGTARGQREGQRLRRVVDPVDVGVAHGRRHRGRTALLPALDQDQGPLVPERQVGQHARHRPARGKGTG
jgi:hypothetical protein